MRLAVVAVVLALASLPAVAQKPTVAGFVDGQSFIDVAGDDAVSVEVSLHGSLLRAVAGADPDLAALVRGLESIHAVILDLTGGGERPRVDPERLAAAIRSTERALRERGWSRLAQVREPDSDLRVLVLEDERGVRGLVVMVLESDEGQMVFANVAGDVDLAALQKLGERLSIPGLGDLDDR